MGVPCERSHDPGPTSVEPFHNVDCRVYSSTDVRGADSTAAASCKRFVDQIPRYISILIGTSAQRGSRFKRPHIPPIHLIDSYQNEGGLELNECSRYGREVALFGQGRDVGLQDTLVTWTSASRDTVEPYTWGGLEISNDGRPRNEIYQCWTASLSLWVGVNQSLSSGDLLLPPSLAQGGSERGITAHRICTTRDK